MRRIAIPLLLAAACGAPQEHSSCASDAACAPGQVCERAGGDGVCVVPYRLALTGPASGAWIGGPVAVAATVEVLVASRTAPATLELLVNGQPAAALARDQGTGTYQGTWAPSTGSQGVASLEAATARGTRAEQRSPARSVQVDLANPALSAVGASCAAACKRDGRLRIAAAVAEPNVAEVTATLDLDPARTIALARQGTSDLFEAQVELAGYPFPHFERVVQATVQARDAAGHQAQASASVQVSRLRWTYSSGATAVTSPAVLTDGTLVVGVSATTGQLRGVSPAGTEAWRLTVGSGAITAAPSVGAAAIWAVSEDGRMYARLGSGSTLRYPTTDPLPAASLFTPAIDASDTAHCASSARRLYAAKADASVAASSPVTDAFSTGLAVSRSGRIFAVTRAASEDATVRGYTFDGAAYTQDWATAPTDAGTSCTRVDAPPALDTNANALVACGIGSRQIFALSPSGTATLLIRLAGKVDGSIAVRADGDLVVGTNDGLLHRLTPGAGSAFQERWAAPLDLGANVTGVALAARDASGVDILAVTSSGGLYAVDANAASIVWSTGGLAVPPLGVAALRFPTIAPPPTGELPTLYVGSADGNLYAVVVDGALDTAAPWPKAHHDVRNTGNAGSPLP